MAFLMTTESARRLNASIITGPEPRDPHLTMSTPHAKHIALVAQDLRERASCRHALECPGRRLVYPVRLPLAHIFFRASISTAYVTCVLYNDDKEFPPVKDPLRRPRMPSPFPGMNPYLEHED